MLAKPRALISKGFTLIEIIVGLVVLGISFSMVLTLIYPAVEHSADQLHQIRAAELGQSMLNEVQNKAFDENSDKTGGFIRCGESGVTCTANDDLGPETGETRASFDDVDDYHNLTYSVGNIVDSQGIALSLYDGYTLSVTVGNDSDYNGKTISNGDNDDDILTAKLITVTVTTPMDFPIVFSTYKANF